MSLQSSLGREEYNCGANPYPIDFPYHEASDIRVFYKNEDGTVELQPAEYTIGAGGITTDYAGGQIIALREVPLTQDLDLHTGDGFLPDAIERQLDRLVMMLQQTNAKVSRCWRMPDSHAGIEPIDTTAKGYAFGLSLDGEPDYFSIAAEAAAAEAAAGLAVPAAESASQSAAQAAQSAAEALASEDAAADSAELAGNYAALAAIQDIAVADARYYLGNSQIAVKGNTGTCQAGGSLYLTSIVIPVLLGQQYEVDWFWAGTNTGESCAMSGSVSFAGTATASVTGSLLDSIYHGAGLKQTVRGNCALIITKSGNLTIALTALSGGSILTFAANDAHIRTRKVKGG